MDKPNVWKEKESSIKSWDWLTVPGKMKKKKFGKDKIMTSKKRNKKIITKLKKKWDKYIGTTK